MNAFVEHLHFEVAGDQSTQRRGEPQLIVVARARIEAHDETHLAEPLAQRIDVRQQIVAARLLAGFDQTDATRTLDALRVQRGKCGDARVDRVAVVGAAAAVELVVLELGRPRPEVVAPAVELGLLVEVAVQHDGFVAARTGRRRLEEDHRRAARQANDFEFQAAHRLLFGPLRGVGDHALQIAVLDPLGIERRTLGRHGDVVRQRGHDLVVPLAVHEFA